MISDKEIKRRILKIYKEVCENPDQAFDESHFLDFLTQPPHKKNSIRNTFKGARLFNTYFDRIELEFGICFRISDWDAYYSLDGFVQKVKERINKRRGNIIIIKQRKNKKYTYIFECILALIVLLVFKWQGVNWISLLVSIFTLILISWLIRNRIKYRKRINMLYQKIMNEDYLGKSNG